MQRINQRQAVEAIRNKEEFKAGALSGSYRFHPSEYTVWSYGTLIAVVNARGFWADNQRYSVTTSKHQSIVRQAIGEV